ncbi:MAG: baseplate J/gp47 family protein [Candidatus Doudnabacteria bacterium]|nr:baseplate J/gp47 family protein [Candidatus Doudnabacteria bacterium]
MSDPVIIKLAKKDDIATIVKKIKDLKERDIVFELEKGSSLLTSSSNLRLIKRTGEVLGKKIRIATNDPTGKLIARKAEMLAEDEQGRVVQKTQPRMRRSGVDSRFSDIVTPKKILPISTVKSLNVKIPKISESLPKLKKITFAVAILVLVLFGLAIILPQASIIVYARSEPITRDFEVQADKALSSLDQNNLKIPADIITKEVSDTKTFTTAGTKISGTKASGSVTIYNQTSTTLKLLASTTTLVAGGKNFRFTADVSAIRANGQTGPIAITAEDPGDSSNIPAGARFEIKNAALGSRDVYAKNQAALSGGASNGVKIFSQEDFDRAVAAMSDDLVNKVQKDLSDKILPSGATVEVLAKTANKEVGTEAESFDFTMIGRVRGLTYKQDDLKNLINQNINSLLSSDKYLLSDKDQITPRFKSADLNAGKGILVVHYETMIAYKIDGDGLDRLLTGKNGQQIKDILLTKPEIERVDVQFSPFFVKKAPRLNGRIEILTKLNEN